MMKEQNLPHDHGHNNEELIRKHLPGRGRDRRSIRGNETAGRSQQAAYFLASVPL